VREEKWCKRKNGEKEEVKNLNSRRPGAGWGRNSNVVFRVNQRRSYWREKDPMGVN